MIRMNERCRCGAELLADLPMCVQCGVRRPAPRVLVGAGAPGPVSGPTVRPMPAHRGPAVVPVRPAPMLSVPPMPAPVPPAPARSSAPWIVAAATVVVLAVVGAVAVMLLRPAPVAAPIVAAPAPAPVTVTVAPGVTTSSTSGSTGALRAAVAASDASVESLAGMWVPQLSSKRNGTVDNGTTYDAASIYAHYQALAAAHPGALLLWSGDWSTYRESDYWVVISGQGFTTAAGANAWCDAQGFAADDCYAKRLSHTAGPSSAAVPRS
jgi:hypothetical protein